MRKALSVRAADRLRVVRPRVTRLRRRLGPLGGGTRQHPIRCAVSQREKLMHAIKQRSAQQEFGSLMRACMRAQRRALMRARAESALRILFDWSGREALGPQRGAPLRCPDMQRGWIRKCRGRRSRAGDDESGIDDEYD
eukprot:gene15936-biopygen2858